MSSYTLLELPLQLRPRLHDTLFISYQIGDDNPPESDMAIQFENFSVYTIRFPLFISDRDSVYTRMLRCVLIGTIMLSLLALLPLHILLLRSTPDEWEARRRDNEAPYH